VKSAAIVLAALIAAGTASAAFAAEGYRAVDPQDLLVIQTTKGRVLLELRPDVAPKHVARVKLLARKGYYDTDVFYRVITDYIAQTGQKNVGGVSASGEGTLPAEFTFRAEGFTPVPPSAGFLGSLPTGRGTDGVLWVKYCPGVAAMAHYESEDSADSQFFLMLGRVPDLEKTFTAWGRVVSGLEVVKSLNLGEPPADPDRMVTVKVAADLPEASRPKVEIAEIGSESFTAAIAAAKTARGMAFGVCDVQVPVIVSN
jgi:peptidylprolyl isomerase